MLGAVILSLLVIAIRTICRFVGSLIFNIVNIFVGIKNLFVLTMQEGKWWRWPFLIVKLPVVLTIQVIKLVLTATFGTLFNFFESIFMMFELVSSKFKNKTVKTRYLYNRHKPGCERKLESKGVNCKVLLTFMCGAIDIVFNKSYPSVSMLFLCLIGKFLSLGQSDNGIVDFNQKVVTTKIYANDGSGYGHAGRFYRGYVGGTEQGKENSKPAITAAGIIATFEVV